MCRANAACRWQMGRRCWLPLVTAGSEEEVARAGVLPEQHRASVGGIKIGRRGQDPGSFSSVTDDNLSPQWAITGSWIMDGDRLRSPGACLWATSRAEINRLDLGRNSVDSLRTSSVRIPIVSFAVMSL